MSLTHLWVCECPGYQITKRNAYPTAEADRYRNHIGYSRCGSRKCRGAGECVHWGWCGFRVDGCG
ncbi:hypothetical protein K503DRAFT_773414 [Rhizopogon vinicolor AM-OR11-026]|uniref:Uncharacterized protein n=1 Tax=Rhizopogon vinicolor AM-OR11-026 TaxID=1314800 RepID=A0A1B7MSC9_9AGAM|nr:hypothetical protein K503DRAFT_773414 [Rhizopogon vinicolor AM-OR11-026]